MRAQALSALRSCIFGIIVFPIYSNTLRKLNSRGFCELCSQKTPRRTSPVNNNRIVTLIVHFIVWDCIFPEKTVFYKTDEETHDYINEHRRKRGAHYENMDEWFNNSCDIVSIGSAIIKLKDPAKIEAETRKYIERVKKLRMQRG